MAEEIFMQHRNGSAISFNAHKGLGYITSGKICAENYSPGRE